MVDAGSHLGSGISRFIAKVMKDGSDVTTEHRLQADAGRKMLPPLRQGLLAEPQYEGQGEPQHELSSGLYSIRKQEDTGSWA